MTSGADAAGRDFDKETRGREYQVGRGDISQITYEPYRHVNSRAEGFIISIEMYTRGLS